MMGIMVSETCWASNKICNKNHLLHLAFYSHILTTMHGQNHIKFNIFLSVTKSVMQLTALKPIQDLNKVFSDSVRRLMLKKHIFSKTGSTSVFRWKGRKAPTALRSTETKVLSHWVQWLRTAFSFGPKWGPVMVALSFRSNCSPVTEQQWVQWLSAALSTGPNSVFPHHFTCRWQQIHFPKYCVIFWMLFCRILTGTRYHHK